MQDCEGMMCSPMDHNRLHESYDGRMAVIQVGNGWHRERCKVCGTEFLQAHAWKLKDDEGRESCSKKSLIGCVSSYPYL